MTSMAEGQDQPVSSVVADHEGELSRSTLVCYDYCANFSQPMGGTKLLFDLDDSVA